MRLEQLECPGAWSGLSVNELSASGLSGRCIFAPVGGGPLRDVACHRQDVPLCDLDLDRAIVQPSGKQLGCGFNLMWISEPATPDSRDTPSAGEEFCQHRAVPSDVCLELGLPEIRAC